MAADVLTEHFDYRQMTADDELRLFLNFLPLLAAAALADAYYLIELDGDAGGITSLAGRLLDGEYRDTNIAGNISQSGWNDSPSGDGIPGGDYRAMFVVSAPGLLVDIPTTSFAENAGAAAAVGIVTRSLADIGTPLTVTLATSDTTEATLPVTVTILAGQASATFNIAAVDYALLDGTQSVTITASASGIQSGSDVVSVTDLETLSLGLTTGSISEFGGTTTGTVTRSNTDRSLALVVTLGSGDTSEATVPATVTIPANQASVTFIVTAVSDLLRDGTQQVHVVASTSGYLAATADIDVTDNELDTLLLSLSSDLLSEHGGTLIGTVTRIALSNALPLVLALASSDTTAAIVPATLTIPAGEGSAVFTITGLDDSLNDGTPREGAKPIRVVVWDEQQPAQNQAYDNFLGNELADHLGKQPAVTVRSTMQSRSLGRGAGFRRSVDLVGARPAEGGQAGTRSQDSEAD